MRMSPAVSAGYTAEMKRSYSLALGVLVVVAAVLGVAFCTADVWSDDESGGRFAEEWCNVAGINAHGDFVTYASTYDSVAEAALNEAPSEEIVAAIEAAEASENIKAILLDIDSYGGMPVAGEEVANTLRSATKPTVALIRGAGTSAAYWAATGADYIVASALSDVGSIGATFSYTDAAEYNKQQGYTFNQLSTGIYKDFGNPDKPLTAAERALVMRDLEIIKDKFVQAVATNRNLSVADVEKLADGSSVLGEAALAQGLIDQIGSYAEAEKYLKKQAGEPSEVCW
jgi:protease IV